MKKLLYCVSLMIIFGLNPCVVQAQSITASLLPAAGAAYSPRETLRIDLPDDLDIDILTVLGVELDDIDITAFISLEDHDFLYAPAEPLAAGDHVIRLFLMSLDGAPAENIGQWHFSVEPAPVQHIETREPAPSQNQVAEAEGWLRGGSFSADTMTEISNRTFEKNSGTALSNHTIASGGGDVNAGLDREGWSVNGRGSYLLQSDHDLSQTGNTLDIAEYELTANYTGDDLSGSATLGHHDIGINSFLMSSFYRRGASVRLGDNNGRVEGKAFAFRPESVAGARDITGIHDNDDRLEGVSTSIQPFSNDIHALRVTGLYYSGRGDDGGLGIAGGSTGPEGSGYAAIVDKGFMDGRLTLRGEYANAEYDGDGNTPGGLEEENSDAYSFGLEARPFESPVFLDKAVDFMIGGKYERVDTFFASLANQGIAADHDAYSAYSNFYWGSLSAGLQVLHQTNNVDDLSSVPTDRLRNASLNVSYNFNPQENRLSWLGTPYMGLSAFVADNDRIETPMGYIGSNTNNVSDSATFNFGTSYDKWYWSTSHTVSEYEDHANVSNDTVNNLTGLNGGWSVNDRLDLTGGAQMGSFRDEDAATTTYDTNLQLGLTAIIIPDTLNTRFDYNLNLASGSGDTPDRQVFNSETEWTLFAAQTNRPGLSLALRGSMEDINGNANAILDETNYQVYTVLRIRAPLAFGR